MKIYVTKINEVYLKISCEESIFAELSEYFTFEIPGARFTPKFRSGIWDGKIRLLNYKTNMLYAGLFGYVEKFCERNGYELEYVPTENHEDPRITNNLNKDVVAEWINSLEHSSKGNAVQVYPHQIDGIYTALNENRVTLESPTSSGKSLMIYSMIRWHLNFKRKILLIVPTTQLCEQMYSDFADYSGTTAWNVEDHCQRLYSGFSKIIEKPVLISTWQSLIKQPPEYYKQFDVVICDEVHLAKGASITSILEKMTNTKYRIGLTGTLDDAKVNQLVVTGLFDRVHKVITTRELMDAGKVVDLDIRGIILKHNEEDRKLIKGAEFKDEMAFLTQHQKRNKFIAGLAISCKGNTLVLCTLIDKHLKPLTELIKKKVGEDRNVYMIYGDIKPEDRETIRLQLASESNAIILGSFATMSTGINIPSIENIILASSSKSKIRNLQSIGRGLRLMTGKTKCKLFDIADNLTHKKKENHVFRHFKERLEQYAKEEFEFRFIEIDL